MGGRGARSAIGKNAIMRGTTGTVSRSAAANALKSGFTVKAAGGKNVRFSYKINNKYINGEGRKEGPSKARLYDLGRAVIAVRKANEGVYDMKNNNPPQIMYLHRFSEKASMVVFVDANKRNVRGFTYNSSGSNRFLNHYKKQVKKPGGRNSALPGGTHGR